MRVLCNSNEGSALSAKYLGIGNTPESVFHVQVGTAYSVFAIAVYRGATLLLLSDDDGLPNWYPVDLFSIKDNKIPADWLIAVYSGNDEGLQFLMGYERLVSEDSHYEALLERDPAALSFFRSEAQSEHRNRGRTP
jgi:hypothetical protein